MDAVLENAKRGDGKALDEMWNLCSTKLLSAARGIFHRHPNIFTRNGVELQDLEQESYLAFRYAVEHFDGRSLDEFRVYLYATFKYWAISLHSGVHGGKCRVIKGENGKNIAVSANPLDFCQRTDAPLADEEKPGTGLYELCADPEAEKAFLDAEAEICAQELHDYIEAAMRELPEQERIALRAVYYAQLPKDITASLLDEDTLTAHRHEIIGLYRLRGFPVIQWCWNEYVLCRAWHGTGHSAWKNLQGSIEERILEGYEDQMHKARQRTGV